MDGIYLDAVREALKLFYLPGLQYQLNERASAFLAQIERDSQSVEGDKIVMAMRYGRVGGVGNRTDYGDLPTPNPRKTKQAKWETKNLFSRFRITDKVIKAARSSVGAFANLLEQEIADCENDAKIDLSRQALGDGLGVLTKINDTPSGSGNVVLPVASTMFLCEGMLIDVCADLGTPKNSKEVEITVVNEDDSTITVQHLNSGSWGTDPANEDYIVIHGNSVGDGEDPLELTGLDAVMNPKGASLYGITLATNRWLYATRQNVNGQLSEMHIQKAIDRADIAAGTESGFIICSHGVRRAYLNLMQSMKQFVNTLELKGGWTALSYNGIPLVADKFIAAGKMYVLDIKDWRMYQMGDYDWLDRDGAMLARVANKAAWEATLVKYCDIGCRKPRGQVELYGITEH